MPIWKFIEHNPILLLVGFDTQQTQNYHQFIYLEYSNVLVISAHSQNKRKRNDQTRWHIVWLLFLDNVVKIQDEKPNKE